MNRRVREAKAEVIAELKRLAGREKVLVPSEVVKSARNKKSPLHNEFEWDDAKAGHEYRLVQARTLIRVSIPEIEGEPDPWVHVPPTTVDIAKTGTREGVYRPMSVVVKHIDWFTRALMELQTKLNAAKEAAEQLQAAAASSTNPDAERMAKITLAINALQTAGAAVSSMH